MIKVLHFVATVGTPGGVQSLLKNYYELIDHSKIHFDFAVFDKNDFGFEKEFTDMGCKIYYIPPKKAGLKNHINAIKKIFENEKYDIVHTHQNFRGALTIYEAWKYKIPVRIVHSHRANAPESFKVKILRKMITPFIKRMSTDWWACGKAAAIWMFGQRAFETNKVHILNNAIDVLKFDYNEAIRNEYRKKLNVENNFVIGMVGRFYMPKNHAFLVKLFEKLHNQNPNARLLLVGEGELQEDIIKMVKELNLTNYVIFTGAKKNVSDYLQAMDVFVLTSIFEGLPVVLVEAQSAGLPCVTSKRVTDEVCVTDLVTYLEHDASDDVWIKAIKDYSTKKRKSYRKIMEKSIYNIKKEAKELELLYERRVKDEKRV